MANVGYLLVQWATLVGKLPAQIKCLGGKSLPDITIQKAAGIREDGLFTMGSSLLRMVEASLPADLTEGDELQLIAPIQGVALRDAIRSALRPPEPLSKKAKQSVSFGASV